MMRFRIGRTATVMFAAAALSTGCSLFGGGDDEEADKNASGFDAGDSMGGEGAGPVSVPELEAVYFDYDRSSVREDQKGTLRSNSQQINSHSEWATVVVEGHCDERGSEEYNLALGERRATSVKQYLTTSASRGARRHGELRREQAGRAGPRRVRLEVEPPRRVQGHQALASAAPRCAQRAKPSAGPDGARARYRLRNVADGVNPRPPRSLW